MLWEVKGCTSAADAGPLMEIPKIILKRLLAIQMTVPGMFYRQDSRGSSSWEQVFMLATEQRRR